MKTKNPSENDGALSVLLREWKVEATLPPRLKEEVWRRIQHTQVPASSSVWVVIAQWIATVLPRPVLAVSYVSVLLAVGGTFGWAQAHQETAHVKGELGDRYVRILDPYQAPRE